MQTNFDALLALAAGDSPSASALEGLQRISSTRREFAALREAADILRAGPTRPLVTRALGTELFRSQHDFNHTVVDLLEEWPWLHRVSDGAVRERARLLPLVAVQPQVPRKAGLKGQLIAEAKGLSFRVVRPRFATTFRALEASNRAVLLAVQASHRAEAFKHLAHAQRLLIGTQPALDAWVGLQRRFLSEFMGFVDLYFDRAQTFEAAALAATQPLPDDLSTALEPLPTLLMLDGATLDFSDPSLERVTTLAQATRPIVVRVPAGEVLTRSGLRSLVRPFVNPQVMLTYGNAANSTGGCFRPAWSPERLLNDNYLGGCFAVRRSQLERVGLDERHAAHHWLLAMQLEEHEVRHVRQVVSVQLEVGEREAEVDSDVLVEAVTKQGLVGHAVRVGGRRVLSIAPPPQAQVTIVVPFKDRVDLLEELWRTLTTYDAGVAWNLVLASNQSTQPETFAFLTSLRDPRVHWFEWNRPFNYSAINNAAARLSTGSHVLFLNNDIAIRHHGWLGELVGYSSLAGVGAVGCRLLYPDDSLQHAGVVIGLKGLAGHAFARWRPEYGSTPAGDPAATGNWSAVTGACLLMRRQLFEEVGGFDERMVVSGSDIELCLKVRELGLRVVCVGHVELTHFESLSRGKTPVSASDLAHELIAYQHLLHDTDPYWDPALSRTSATGTVALWAEAPTDHAIRVAFGPLVSRNA